MISFYISSSSTQPDSALTWKAQAGPVSLLRAGSGRSLGMGASREYQRALFGHLSEYAPAPLEGSVTRGRPDFQVTHSHLHTQRHTRAKKYSPKLKRNHSWVAVRQLQLDLKRKKSASPQGHRHALLHLAGLGVTGQFSHHQQEPAGAFHWFGWRGGCILASSIPCNGSQNKFHIKVEVFKLLCNMYRLDHSPLT